MLPCLVKLARMQRSRLARERLRIDALTCAQSAINRIIGRAYYGLHIPLTPAPDSVRCLSGR